MTRVFAALVGTTMGLAVLAASQGSVQRPNLPVAASSLGAVVCDEFLYIYGGHADKPHTYAHETTSGRFYRLDLREPAAHWEELPGGPHLQGMNLAVHKGRIIRVGGMEPRNKKEEKPLLFSTAAAAMYDPRAKKWSALPDLPAPRSSHDVVVLGDRVFVVGGWRLDGEGTSGSWHNTVLVLDLAAEKPRWKSIPQPFRRRALTAAAHDGKVYVLGGLTPKGLVKKVDVYDPVSNAWSTGPAYPGSRRSGFSPAVCTFEERLYLNTADGDILQLNAKGDGWDKIGAVATPRVVHRLLPWKGALLVVGGTGEKGNVPEIESVSVAEKTGPAPVPAPETGAWRSLHNGGNTSIDAGNMPLAWSPEKGIAWSARLPGYGQSAPVVWAGQVYVTTIEGDHKETCFVQAYDIGSGRCVWEHEFAAAVRMKNSYMVSRAAPTPVVDRDGVYALFESGDLHALTHDGKIRWIRSLFDDAGRKFDNAHGYGASPTQTSKAVVVLVDHQGPSYLLALSKETGEPLWKTKRKPRSSWTSPQVAKVGEREQVVVSSSGTVDGYDAETGKSLWSHNGLSGNSIPSVTVQGSRLYVGASLGQRVKDADSVPASNCCLRIAPDTKAGYEVLWKAKKALCHYVSPLVHRGHVYYVNQVGILYCLDAETGKEVYAERTSGPCWAEPIAAGEHVYLFHKDGRTTVVKAGAKFQVVRTNRLWQDGSGPLPDRSYDYEPRGPKDSRPRKPPAHYGDPIVYGVAAANWVFCIRTGTCLYCSGRRNHD